MGKSRDVKSYDLWDDEEFGYEKRKKLEREQNRRRNKRSKLKSRDEDLDLMTRGEDY